MMNFMRKSMGWSAEGENRERANPTHHRSRVVLWHPRRSQSRPWQSWSWSRVTMMLPVAAEGTRSLASAAQLDHCGSGCRRPILARLLHVAHRRLNTTQPPRPATSLTQVTTRTCPQVHHRVGRVSLGMFACQGRTFRFAAHT